PQLIHYSLGYPDGAAHGRLAQARPPHAETSHAAHPPTNAALPGRRRGRGTGTLPLSRSCRGRTETLARSAPPRPRRPRGLGSRTRAVSAGARLGPPGELPVRVPSEARGAGDRAVPAEARRRPRLDRARAADRLRGPAVRRGQARARRVHRGAAARD